MLNKQKGNMYGFVTHTWNPIKGKCFHECSYCYMKKWGEQKPIRLVDKELKIDLGIDNFIFVGSSCDLFAQDVPKEWIDKTISHCIKYDNQYLFQTKNTRRLQFFTFPEKSIICTTIESNFNLDDNFAPSISERVKWFQDLPNKKMITIEPIMDFDIDKLIIIIETINPFQINIGADSGNHKLKEPTKDKIDQLISYFKKTNIKIFGKQNLKRLTGTSYNSGYEAR